MFVRLSRQLASVRVGSNYHNRDGELVKIAKIVVNPHYVQDSLVNNIALIRLVKSLTFNDVVKQAVLATYDDELYDGTKLTISGWGFDNVANGRNPFLLKKATVYYQELEICKNAYSKRSVVVPSGTICAGEINYIGSSICEGDQGGPLVQTTKAKGDRVFGIASFALNCGATFTPSVFTDVRQYLDWINQVLMTN